MGQILDFVPNHVGIGDSRNQWWMDVLENGPSSRYAPYFDIDWQPRKFDLRDKVLLPILSDQYGRVLERGEFQVRFEEGTFYLLYGERRLPMAPGTYRYILDIGLQNLADHKEEDYYAQLQSILTALEYLPKRTESDPKRITERIREKEISNDAWSGFVPKRRKCIRPSKRRWRRSMENRAMHAASTLWMNCLTRNPTALLFGASPLKKSITGVFST